MEDADDWNAGVARRFTLTDVMIMIAMTAPGLILLRYYEAYRPPAPPPGFPKVFVWESCMWASPFVLPYAIGLLAVRLRHPRPPWHLMYRQPGTAACVAILFYVLANWSLIAVRTLMGPLRFNINVYLSQVISSGHAIALAWIILWLARAWRPEADWIDRSGRILGTLMIVVWLLTGLNL